MWDDAEWEKKPLQEGLNSKYKYQQATNID